MQQPPDPYGQYQQPYNAPTSPYAPQPPYPYNPPPQQPSGFRHWLRTRSRKAKLGIGCGSLIAAMLLCIGTASCISLQQCHGRYHANTDAYDRECRKPCYTD